MPIEQPQNGFDFDFSPDADKDPTLMPEGEYRAMVTDALEGTSQAGNPQITLTLTPVDQQWADKTLKTWLTFTKKAENMTLRRLRALGFNVQPGGRFTARGHDFINRFCVVKIKHEMFNERMQAKVADIKPDAAGVRAPAQAAPAQAPQAGEAGVPREAQRQAPAPAAPPPVDDSSIPF